MERFLQINTRCDGDPGGGRTHNLQLRRLTLYPIELRDRESDSSIHTPTCQAGKTRDRRSASTGGLIFGGRGERIRTSDLSVPNAALYQAEPRPELKTGAEGGSRTHTRLPPAVFETAASAIPPLRQRALL